MHSGLWNHADLHGPEQRKYCFLQIGMEPIPTLLLQATEDSWLSINRIKFFMIDSCTLRAISSRSVYFSQLPPYIHITCIISEVWFVQCFVLSVMDLGLYLLGHWTIVTATQGAPKQSFAPCIDVKSSLTLLCHLITDEIVFSCIMQFK